MFGLEVKNLNSAADASAEVEFEIEDSLVDRFKIHLSGRTRTDLCLPIAFGIGFDRHPIRNTHPSLFLRPEYCRNEPLIEYAEDYFDSCYRHLIRLEGDLLDRIRKTPLFISLLNFAFYSARDEWIENLAAVFYELKIQSDELYLLTALISRINGQGLPETLYASMLIPDGPHDRYYQTFVSGIIPHSNRLTDFDRASLHLLNGRIQQGVSILSRMEGAGRIPAIRELLDLYIANGKYWLFLKRLKREDLPYDPELFYEALFSAYRLDQISVLERVIDSVLPGREPPGDLGTLRDSMDSKALPFMIPLKFYPYVQTHRLLSGEPGAELPPSDRLQRNPERWAAAYFAKCLRERIFPDSIPALFGNCAGRNYYARILTGLYYDSKKEFARASEYILQSPPWHPYIRQVRAKLDFMTGNGNAAHADLLYLLKTFPDDANLWYNFSVILAYEGRQREAQIARERSISLDPGLGKK